MNIDTNKVYNGFVVTIVDDFAATKTHVFSTWPEVAAHITQFIDIEAPKHPTIAAAIADAKP